jgi:uncharacterized protein
MHDLSVILQSVLDRHPLAIDGDHGITHWARVQANGVRLADAVGAARKVVALFSLSHDSCWLDEFKVDGHGLRGAELARSLRGTLGHLDDARSDLLYEACRLYLGGRMSGDPTELACRDADRLDLGRVGITPDPRRLVTDAARGLADWTHPRAVGRHVPRELLAAWGWVDSAR